MSCVYLSVTLNVQHRNTARDKAMRKTAWIWFVGCAVWIVDGVVQVRLHAFLHAQLAFMIALLFLVAGFFYRNQKS